MTKPAASMAIGFRRALALFAVLCLAGCDLLTVSQTGRNIREGNEALVRGEVQRALQNFESALDGTMLSAEAHYRLGLLYEDQLKNEIGALHHFERYLELAPQGQFSTDVKAYVERLRLMIVSRLSDGPVLPAREAARLKNENLALKQQLTEMRQGNPPPPRQVVATNKPAPAPAPVAAATPTLVVAATPPPLPTAPAAAEPNQPEVRRALPVNASPAGAVSAAAAPAQAPAPGSADTAAVRTYRVESGDTLAGIARKFYKNSGQWPKIMEANKATLADPTKLKPDMVLVIP